MLINRNLVSRKFSYKPNEFNYRYGFPEEKHSLRSDLNKRIDYYKYTLRTHCKIGKNDKLHLSITHLSLDYFAIIFAALELGIVLSCQQETANCVIHNNIEFNLQYRNWHVADIAQIEISNTDLFNHIITKQPEESSSCMILDNKILSHAEVYDLIYLETLTITGSVYHVAHKDYFTNIFLILTMLFSDNITFHTGLGYNNLDSGIGKLILGLLYNDVDNIIVGKNLQPIIMEKLIENKRRIPNFVIDKTL